MGLMERALPMPARVEHSEWLSLRSLVWGYPMPLASLSSDPETGMCSCVCVFWGMEDRRYHSYLQKMLSLIAETWNSDTMHQ